MTEQRRRLDFSFRHLQVNHQRFDVVGPFHVEPTTERNTTVRTGLRQGEPPADNVSIYKPTPSAGFYHSQKGVETGDLLKTSGSEAGFRRADPGL
jgi:hypothetical protein